MTGQRRIRIPGSTPEERAEAVARLRGIDAGLKSTQGDAVRKALERVNGPEGAFETEAKRVNAHYAE